MAKTNKTDKCGWCNVDKNSDTVNKEWHKHKHFFKKFEPQGTTAMNLWRSDPQVYSRVYGRKSKDNDDKNS